MEENSEKTLPTPPFEPPPPNNARKGKRKIFIGLSLLAIAFILLIIFSVLWEIFGFSRQVDRIPILPTSTPTPDLYTESSRSATASWKTYTNKEYKFSLKYPPNWNYLEYGSIFFSPQEIEFIEGPASPIVVSFRKGDSIQKRIEELKKSYEYTDFKEEIVVIDGIEARKISGIVGPNNIYLSGTFNIAVFIPFGSNLINFTYYEVSESIDVNTVDKILSTFEFTNSSVDNSTRNEIEEAIRQDVSRYYSGTNYVLTDIEKEGNWALVSGYLEEADSGDIVTPGGVTYMAKFENGRWEVDGFNSERGRRWACEIPSVLISSDDLKYLLGNDFSC